MKNKPKGLEATKEDDIAWLIEAIGILSYLWRGLMSQGGGMVADLHDGQ